MRRPDKATHQATDPAHHAGRAARFPTDNAAESFDAGTGRPPGRAYFTDQAAADRAQAAEHSTRGSGLLTSCFPKQASDTRLRFSGGAG